MRSQKEAYTDLGQVYSLPMRYINGFDRINGDTTKIVLVGRKNDKLAEIFHCSLQRETQVRRVRLKKRG